MHIGREVETMARINRGRIQVKGTGLVINGDTQWGQDAAEETNTYIDGNDTLASKNTITNLQQAQKGGKRRRRTKKNSKQKIKSEKKKKIVGVEVILLKSQPTKAC